MSQYDKPKKNTKGMLDGDPEFESLGKIVRRAEELEDYLGEDGLSNEVKEVLTHEQEKLKFFKKLNDHPLN